MVGPVPANFSFRAWGVKYEYQDSDSAFVSDNITLNAVYELSRWTLDGGVIDTYTDSNTRERRPYECDGLIASANRQLLQSDAMWARHSHRWFSHMHYFVQHAQNDTRIILHQYLFWQLGTGGSYLAYRVATNVCFVGIPLVVQVPVVAHTSYGRYLDGS